jgi:hypothetical protein
MPLDLGLLGQQITAMVQVVDAEGRRRLLAQARDLLTSIDPLELGIMLKQRTLRLPWLVAVPGNSLAGSYASGKCPPNYCAVAADGSSLGPDRHNPVRFYVINAGYAALIYGEHPSAALDSSAQLYFRDEDLYLDPLIRSAPVEGARLSAKMCLAEMGALWEAARLARDLPVVALRDGSLITWGLQSEDPSFVQEHFLGEFLGYLDRFREAAIPVASYISYPGARDVVNALRAWICPQKGLECDSCSPSGVVDLCRGLLEITDRELFGFLAEGERSDVFGSASAILDRYGEHSIKFFYMNVGGEVVRLEAPQWVAEDEAALGLVQAAIHDQCRRSPEYPRYPPVLQEAHEQAVISAAARQVVEVLVQRALAARGLGYVGSAKSLSKRRRTV